MIQQPIIGKSLPFSKQPIEDIVAGWKAFSTINDYMYNVCNVAIEKIPETEFSKDPVKPAGMWMVTISLKYVNKSSLFRKLMEQFVILLSLWNNEILL
jgi:hypothetical protein